MRRFLQTFFILSSASLAGCSICAPGYLDDYATVGGKWQRSDPANGRVGSIFSDPGSTVHAADGYERATYGSMGYADEYYSDGYYDEGEAYIQPGFDDLGPYDTYSPELGNDAYVPGPGNGETIILGEDL